VKTQHIILTALLGATLSPNAASITRLGGLQPNISSTAAGVSADGRVVVGDRQNTNDNQETFHWTREAGMTGLGDLPGGDFRFTITSAPDAVLEIMSSTNLTAWSTAGFTNFFAPPGRQFYRAQQP